jgi:hypothetical protein
MNLKPQDCIVFDGAQDMMIPFKYNRKKEKKKEKRGGQYQQFIH